VLEGGRAVSYHRAVPLSIARDVGQGWFRVIATGTLDMDDVLRVIATVRATVETRMVPMVFDARQATGVISDAHVARAVAAVSDVVKRIGTRGHVAIVAGDAALYDGMMRYETGCAAIGVRVIRVFRQLPDAERWLEIVSAVRDFD
jgi:hypothetical protein